MWLWMDAAEESSPGHGGEVSMARIASDYDALGFCRDFINSTPSPRRDGSFSGESAPR